MPAHKLLFLVAALGLLAGESCAPIDVADDPLPIVPDKVVVLTFDDSVESHYSVVGPLLQKYGFGATFFITEGFDFHKRKDYYMTWEQIAALHKQGFEIGNHTRDHMGVNDANVSKLSEQLAAIEAQCAKHGIPKPISFAWPGNAITPKAIPVLQEHGIEFARRGGSPEYTYESGGGLAFEPGRDHPLLIPSAADARPTWKLEDFVRGVRKATKGKPAVMQFHGVPDKQHPWVHLPPEIFEQCMKYLHDNKYTVIALRDLAKYRHTKDVPEQWDAVIKERIKELKSAKPSTE